MNNLDHFTDNLEGRVDQLLGNQQKEFVQGYKQHMDKIKT